MCLSFPAFMTIALSFLISIGGTACSRNDTVQSTIIYPALPAEEARKLAFDYYASKYGDTDVLVTIENLGCHIEGFVVKDNKIIKRLSINPLDRSVYETG